MARSRRCLGVINGKQSVGGDKTCDAHMVKEWDRINRMMLFSFDQCYLTAKESNFSTSDLVLIHYYCINIIVIVSNYLRVYS